MARVGKAILGQVPNPDSPVGDDQHFPSLGQAPLEGFAMELAGEFFDTVAGGDVATLADDRALAGGLAAVVQTKDGGHVNPMPAVGVLFLLAQGLGQPPVVPFADVPGVNFDDQSERVGRGFGGDLAGQCLNVFPSVELSVGLGAGGFGFETLTVGLAVEGAAAQIQTEAFGYQHRLLRWHLGDEQGCDFLEIGGGGRFAAQAQGIVSGEVPLLAVRTPAVPFTRGRVAERGAGVPS